MRRYLFAGSLLATAGAALTVWSCRPFGATQLKDTFADDPRFANMQLTMNGNAATGEISASFSYQGSDFQPGEQVGLVFDVVSNGSGRVNCSALKKQATVTLAGSGQTGTFTTRVDPKEFESPIQPHPQGLAKFDTTRKDAVYNGPMKVEGCFVYDGRPVRDASTPVADTGSKGAKTQGFGLAEDENDMGDGKPNKPGIIGYAQVCASRLGKIPAFSCLDDNLFRELPVTVTADDGSLTSPEKRVSKCDHPIYLPTGESGNCKPWARIGKIKTSPTAYAAVVCRRYWPESSSKPNPLGAGSGAAEGLEYGDAGFQVNPSGPRDPFFNDVAIVQADTKTGETCFFQALGVLYGERVPPPDEKTLPEDVVAAHPNAKNADSFWLEAQGTASINCINCHDADPWMHSPYVRQVVDPDGEVFLPSKPNVKNYILLGGEYGFRNWTTSYTIEPGDGKGDACLGCHKIGSLNGCTSWVPDVGTGRHFSSAKTKFGKTFPKSHWMPPDHGEESGAAWESSYLEAIQAFKKCCNVAGAKLGIDGEFEEYARYSKTLDADEMQRLKTANCVVTPRSSFVIGIGNAQPLQPPPPTEPTQPTEPAPPTEPTQPANNTGPADMQETPDVRDERP